MRRRAPAGGLWGRGWPARLSGIHAAAGVAARALSPPARDWHPGRDRLTTPAPSLLRWPGATSPGADDLRPTTCWRPGAPRRPRPPRRYDGPALPARPERGDRGRARSRARPDARARRAVPRRKSCCVRPRADVAAGVGSRSLRELRRAVAASRRSQGTKPTDPLLDDIYNAFDTRGGTSDPPLLSPRRPRVHAESAAGPWTSWRGSSSHRESVSSTRLRLRHGRPARAPARRDDAGDPPADRSVRPTAIGRHPRAEAAPPQDMVLVPGRPVRHGTATEPWAYDNERPRIVDVPSFWIDTVPDQGAVRAFI